MGKVLLSLLLSFNTTDSIILIWCRKHKPRTRLPGVCLSILAALPSIILRICGVLNIVISIVIVIVISFLWSQSRWSDGESYRPPILADWSLLASCPTIHNIAYAITQYPQYCIYIVYMHLLSIHYPQYRIYTILGILWIDLISALLTICWLSPPKNVV